MSGRRRRELLRDELRDQLWPLPTLAVVLAVGLGIALPIVDGAVDGELADVVSGYLFGGGPEAARAVLQAIAGSLITVTSLTFSLTVVTLQLASSQFSPRLLRTFTRDRFVHGTLAMFLATFAFALTVLRKVRTKDDAGDGFVPEISVTVAFVVALASVITLVFFLAHLTREIRVESMVRNVHAETAVTISKVFPPGAAPRPAAPSVPPAGATLIESGSSGFLLRVDEENILRTARTLEAVIWVDREPGSALIEGVPFARAWPLHGASFFSPDQERQLREAVNDAIVTGYERTSVQDVSYGFRQLIDVAAKALSPGVNDPTTASHALGHVSGLLCLLIGRDLGDRLLQDEQDEVRVVLHRPDLSELLDLALDQPLLFGSKDPAIMQRLLLLLQEVAWCDRNRSHRQALDAKLTQLTSAIGDQAYPAADRQRLDEISAEVAAALLGRWVSRS